MTNRVYNEILKPMNQCNLTGQEQVVKSERIGVYRITVYKDNWGQHRVVLSDVHNKLNVSSILYDQYKIKRFQVTVEDYRGHRFTRQLHAYINSNCKGSFKHSENLTEAGLAAI